MKFKCIFFDFDGVIIENSQSLAFDILSEMLIPFGATLEKSYFNKHLVGIRGEEVIALLSKKFGIHIPPTTLTQIRKQHEDKLSTHSALGKNLEKLLPLLPEKYICSSSHLSYINPLLITHHIKQYFPDECIFSANSQQDLKPAPTVYLKALDYTRTPKSDCCAIEDSVVGVLAAKAAGLYTIGYVSQENNNPQQAHLLKQVGADEIIDDFLILR